MTASVIHVWRSRPQTAEDWCARLARGNLSAAERAAFDTWLSNPENRRAYDDVQAVSALCEGLLLAPDLQARLAAQGPPGAQPQTTVRAGWGLRWGVAAAVALVAVLGGVLAYDSWLKTPVHPYQTTTGQMQRVVLDDGSTLELNTQTRLQVQYSAKERRVVLQHGEAFFQVAKAPQRPFVVQSGWGEVRVLGTAFNVRKRFKVAEVAVTEGRVQVRRQPGSLLEKLWHESSAVVSLAPGQRTQVTEAGVQPVGKANIEALTAWRQGKIHFYNEPLSRVFEELNRYSDKKFYLPDPRLQGLTLSGVFKTGDPDALLFALKEAFGLEAMEVDGQIIVRKQAGSGF